MSNLLGDFSFSSLTVNPQRGNDAFKINNRNFMAWDPSRKTWQINYSFLRKFIKKVQFNPDKKGPTTAHLPDYIIGPRGTPPAQATNQVHRQACGLQCGLAGRT